MDKRKHSQQQLEKYCNAPLIERTRFSLVVHDKAITYKDNSHIEPLNTILARFGFGKASLRQVAKLATSLQVATVDFYRHLVRYNSQEPCYRRVQSNTLKEIQKILIHAFSQAESDPEKQSQLLDTKSLEELLAVSVRLRSYQVMKDLLEQNISQTSSTEPGELKAFLTIETPDSNGLTSLMRASQQGNLLEVQLFLQLGGLVNRKGPKRKTPLLFACEQKDADIIRLLLDSKAHSHIWDDDGNTPLHIACIYSVKEVVELLTQHGVSVQIEVKNAQGKTPIDLLNDRLQKQNDREAEELSYYLLLSYARRKKIPFAQLVQAKISKLLIQEKLVELYETEQLISSLHGHPNEGQLLQAITQNQPQESLNELLRLAIIHHFATLCVSLIKRGAKTTEQSPFQLACKEGNLILIKKLLGLFPEELQAKNAMGQTPLHIACSHGQLDLAKLYITQGANLDVTDNAGKSSLTLAATFGHTALIEILLRQPKKPPINDRDLMGQTPFWRAFFGGHIDCCKLLLKEGAFITLDDFKTHLVTCEAILLGRTAVIPSQEQRKNIITLMGILIRRLSNQNLATFCAYELKLAPQLQKEILTSLENLV